jgi:hypothetical protein|tara:strand:+ start:70 stop:390 length:321 start_codon:yes stop_codon:yes gene_type:complete
VIEKEYQYDKNGYRSNRMHDGYRDDLMLPKLDKHLKDVNETYFEHMYHAITYAFTFAVLTITTLIHAMLPFLFVETASRKIREINKHIESRVTSNNTIELNLDKDA